MATKVQGSARPACLPILSSQLHLRVAIRLPLGSTGSHYHHHILMTPINSPSVGPLQPSALKVKGRGTGSGWLFSRMSYRLVCVACVYKHVFITLALRVYKGNVHLLLVYVCTRVYSVCVHCLYTKWLWVQSVKHYICAKYGMLLCVQSMCI